MKRTREESLVADTHALSAGLKAYTTAYTNTALSTCRECCGGHGYAAGEGIGGWEIGGGWEWVCWSVWRQVGPRCGVRGAAGECRCGRARTHTGGQGT